MDEDVTKVLAALETGDAAAADRLLPIVYARMRELADRQMAREHGAHTLQATALAHEAYLRLFGDGGIDAAAQFRNSRHLFGAAAEAMRRILVERARARRAQKRGGDAEAITFDDDLLHVAADPDTLLDLDDALARLSELDAAKGELVKLRFYGGLTLEQTAHVLGISARKADRDWAFARAWLHAALGAGEEP